MAGKKIAKGTGSCLIKYTIGDRELTKMFSTDDIDFATKQLYLITDGKADVLMATVLATSKVHALD